MHQIFRDEITSDCSYAAWARFGSGRIPSGYILLVRGDGDAGVLDIYSIPHEDELDAIPLVN